MPATSAMPATPLISREEVQAVYEAGPDAVFAFVIGLVSQIVEWESRMRELEDRQSKDSHNSGKPPSSDGFARTPQSLREKSEKQSGGQPGHEGKTLRLRDDPDRRVSHAPKECGGCAGSLEDAETVDVERRQVFDLPPMRLEVVEHQVESRRCGRCGKVSRGSFPEGVTQPVQYGAGVRSLLVYLQTYQLLPYNRTCELMEDVFGAPISEGTVCETIRKCASGLETAEKTVQEAITGAKVAHFDETGLRIEGKLWWLHVASSGPFVYYSPQQRRGHEGMRAAGILPDFKGRAVHDAWASYFVFGCDHALCNAHHLRELIYLTERHEQGWAEEMKGLLIEMKDAVEAACAAGKTGLEAETLRLFEGRYDGLLTEGEEANPVLVPNTPPRRGRRKQTPARNMLGRLRRYKEETLAYLHDFTVPFDNNRAERDIRMMKVQQKISGGFRSQEGAEAFCRIRGYIATARNQAHNVLFALRQVFDGHPVPLVSDA